MATRSVNAQGFENPVGALRYAVRPEPSASFAWTYVRFSECSDTVIQAAVNLRGLITSLGAGGSLIAAALCAAVLVGGILAVRGAVDDVAEAKTGDVTLPGGRTAAAQTATPAAGDATPAVAERRAAPPRRARTQRRRGTRPVAPPPPAASEPPFTDDRSGTTGEGAGGGSGPAAPAPPPATGDEPRTVTRVVRQTREAVAPVVEAAPEPVQAAVDQVVDVVEDVGEIVDDTLEPVAGLLPQQ
jgi:hypothetical protein